MIARFLHWLRRGVTRLLEDRVYVDDWRPTFDGPAPPSSAFARDVLHTLVVSGLSPDDAVRVLRPFEPAGPWLGPYTLWGDRPLEADPVRFPGFQTRRRVKLLEHHGNGIPGEVPILLATLYTAETETCDLPPDLDRAWKEVIRVAFATSERCVWDAWVERGEPCVRAGSEPDPTPEREP